MKILFLFLCSFCFSFLNAQDSTEIKLMGKTWIGESYEILGVGKIPLDEDQNGFFKFNEDKSCEAGLFGEEVDNGTWSYNPATKKISIWLIGVGFMQYIKIISLSEKKLIIEIEKDKQKIKGTLIVKE